MPAFARDRAPPGVAIAVAVALAVAVAVALAAGVGAPAPSPACGGGLGWGTFAARGLLDLRAARLRLGAGRGPLGGAGSSAGPSAFFARDLRARGCFFG